MGQGNEAVGIACDDGEAVALDPAGAKFPNPEARMKGKLCVARLSLYRRFLTL